MSSWFEEPHESQSEVNQKHMLEESKCRFVIKVNPTSIGIIDLAKMIMLKILLK